MQLSGPEYYSTPKLTLHVNNYLMSRMNTRIAGHILMPEHIEIIIGFYQNRLEKSLNFVDFTPGGRRKGRKQGNRHGAGFLVLFYGMDRKDIKQYEALFLLS